MARVHSRWLYGNLLYYDTYRHRIIDAVGPGVTKFVLNPAMLDLDDTTNDPTLFTVTTVDGGGDGAGFVMPVNGALVLSTDDADNDGANIQVKGEAFYANATTKWIYFGINLQVSEATQADLLTGLCITDTDLLGGMTDGIYFRNVDASTDVNFVLEKNSTETSSASAVHTLADATNVTLEFVFDGTNVDSWVNGTLQTRLATTNLPNDEYLTPSLQYLAGAVGVKTCTVNWWRAFQIDGTK